MYLLFLKHKRYKIKKIELFEGVKLWECLLEVKISTKMIGSKNDDYSVLLLGDRKWVDEDNEESDNSSMFI